MIPPVVSHIRTYATIYTRRTTVSGKSAGRVVVQKSSRIGAGEERKLDFAPTQRAGLGFTDEDSAGQSNIFAVEPKQYVSDKNTSSNVGTSSDSNDAILTI